MDIEKHKCYYEILNVEKDATAEEIKKSYKKIILQYHPDKNSHLSEEEQKLYTNIFRKIQEAYECLIDERRRKWYDKNRNRIIKGREEEEEKQRKQSDIHYTCTCKPKCTEGECKNPQRVGSKTKINIWLYFNNSCYKGYDDNDENSFYNVYRKLFEEIIKEENMEILSMYKNNKEKMINAPSFGNSKTNGKDIDNFYEYWCNFSTVKKFDCSYEYIKYLEFENRNIRRNFKKISEKKSLKERKEYNENIRSLVYHIKKYDVRYLNRLVELAEEKKKKAEEREKKKQQQMEERRFLFEKNNRKEKFVLDSKCVNSNSVYPDGVTYVTDFAFANIINSDCTDNFSNNTNLNNNTYNSNHTYDNNHTYDSNNLNEVVQQSEEYSKEGEESVFDDEDNIEKIIYRCEVCKKDFKNIKQYNSHEKSKKHVKNFLKNSNKYVYMDIFNEHNLNVNVTNTSDKKEGNNLKKKKKNDRTVSFVASSNKESIVSDNTDDGDIVYSNNSEDINNDYIEQKKMCSEDKDDKSGTTSDSSINDSSTSDSNTIDNLLSWAKKKKTYINENIKIDKNGEKREDSFEVNKNVNDSSDSCTWSKQKKKALKKKKKKGIVTTTKKEVTKREVLKKEVLKKEVIKKEVLKKEVIKKDEAVYSSEQDTRSDQEGNDKVNMTKTGSIKTSNNNPKHKKLKDNIINNYECNTCKQSFTTRNKLFKHIQAEGHAIIKNIETFSKMNKKKNLKK
ncbi:DnaJ protein, putative [Hepatocystis sp. ex Piliocolobus tephrosceles]|nr:DnaJ protein, putative [Hepatocystis sp. ex Piliocolobus tephrosceles]